MHCGGSARLDVRRLPTPRASASSRQGGADSIRYWWQNVFCICDRLRRLDRMFVEGNLHCLVPSAQQRIDASWLAESIASLLWALQMISALPAYDWEADPALASRLRSVPIAELIRQPKLRPKREIEKQRQTAEIWHWRARTRQLQELGHFNGQSVSGHPIEQIIERTARNGARSGRLLEPIGRDFPANGKPYSDLSSDEFATLTSIAQERHKAFNWLCGFSPTGRWTDTRTDT